MIDWIDFGLVRDFASEKTDAYRLCTKRDAWAERYGADILVSYKAEAARDRILRGAGRMDPAFEPDGGAGFRALFAEEKRGAPCART